jgi:peroxiredoxin Q/BCP
VALLGGQEFNVAARAAGSGLDEYNVAFFTASCDTPETNRRYAEALKLDYPILSDPEKTASRAYGVVNDARPLPFRYTFYIGEDGKVLFIDQAVKPATHGADVVKKLRTRHRKEEGITERTTGA